MRSLHRSFSSKLLRTDSLSINQSVFLLMLPWADGKKLVARYRSPHDNVICQFIEVSALLDHRVDEVLTDAIRAFRRQRTTVSKRRRSSPRRPPSSHMSDHRPSNACSTIGLSNNDNQNNGSSEVLDNENESVASDAETDEKSCIQRVAYALLCKFSKWARGTITHVGFRLSQNRSPSPVFWIFFSPLRDVRK